MRPRCFECGRQLMYVKRAGDKKSVSVGIRYVDPAGHGHWLHVGCAMTGGYGTDMVKVYDIKAGPA